MCPGKPNPAAISGAFAIGSVTTGQRQAHAGFDRGDDRRRVRRIGRAWGFSAGERLMQHVERLAEARLRQRFDRVRANRRAAARRGAGECVGVADQRETRNGRIARSERLGGDLKADAGRIAHRDHDRRGRGHRVMIVASRRRLRR